MREVPKKIKKKIETESCETRYTLLMRSQEPPPPPPKKTQAKRKKAVRKTTARTRSMRQAAAKSRMERQLRDAEEAMRKEIERDNQIILTTACCIVVILFFVIIVPFPIETASNEETIIHHEFSGTLLDVQLSLESDGEPESTFLVLESGSVVWIKDDITAAYSMSKPFIGKNVTISVDSWDWHSELVSIEEKQVELPWIKTP